MSATGLFTAPPIDLKDTGGDNQAVIYVVMHLCDWPMYTPAGNRSGTFILRELLDARLKAAGVAFVAINAAFPLNSAQFCILFNDQQPIQAAADVVIETLQRFGLADFSQIAWVCSEDGGFKVIFNPTKREFSRRSVDEMEADIKIMRQICNSGTRPDDPAEQ